MSSEYDPSEHNSSEYTPSENSVNETENSADESGYITSRPSRNPSVEIEEDPYEATPTRPRGPRVITTARKSVPLPRRVSFTNPPRHGGESSRSGAQHGNSRVVTGVPVAHPPGMTARESQWVLFLSQDVQLQKDRLDAQQEHLNAIMGVLNAHHEISDRTMEVVDATRREMRTLYMYLMWVIGALVLMIGMLVRMMMR